MDPIVRTEDYVGPDRRQGRLGKLIDQAIDNGIVLGAIAFSMFLILGTLAYAIVVVNRNAVGSNTQIKHGIQCVLLENIEYRQSAVDFRKRAAEGLGFDPGPDPIGLPPVLGDKVSEVCAEFFSEDEIEEFFGSGVIEEDEEG